jgi:hypothetical protein
MLIFLVTLKVICQVTIRLTVLTKSKHSGAMPSTGVSGAYRLSNHVIILHLAYFLPLLCLWLKCKWRFLILSFFTLRGTLWCQKVPNGGFVWEMIFWLVQTILFLQFRWYLDIRGNRIFNPSPPVQMIENKFSPHGMSRACVPTFHFPFSCTLVLSLNCL